MTIKITWVRVIWFVLVLMALSYFLPTDNSDRSRWHRSGLAVHVDALTGVNYFSTPGLFGLGASVIVRVDTNGQPVITTTSKP